jgi:PAP2 superfamily
MFRQSGGTLGMFERAERFMIAAILLVGALSLGLSSARGVPVAWDLYDVALVFDLLFILLGQFYRTVRKNPAIASAATAVGLLLMAGQLLPVFNYLLLPYKYHGVDQFLAATDAAFGFKWASFAIWMAQFPKLCAFLRTVYASTFLQMAGTVFLLGLVGRTSEVSRMMLATFLGAIITMSVWSLFPSSTPVAFQTLPAGVAATLQLAVDKQMGAELVRLSYEGVALVTPEGMLGMVGFPSFHTVIMLLVLWHTRVIALARVPVAVWNAFMLPAILLHGAHNLIDVFGGAAVAALSIWLARRIVAAGEGKAAEARQPVLMPAPSPST